MTHRTLWPHQARVLEEINTQAAAGTKAMVVSSATGTGKSEVMFQLLRQAAKDHRRAITYCNRRLLFDQLGRGLYDSGISYGVRAAGHRPHLSRDIQLAMIQTERSRVLKDAERELHEAQLVLVDEAHLMANGAAMTIIKRHKEAGATVIGFSATPNDVGHLYDAMIDGATTPEGRQCGALLPAMCYAPDMPDRRFIKRMKTGEEVIDGELQNRWVSFIFGRVVEHWQRYNPERRPTILFAPGVDESKWFAQQFERAGVRAAHIDAKGVWVDGKWHDGDMVRGEVLDRISSGDLEIICNRFVLREGIDRPELYHVILATKFGSETTYVQAVGRGLRNHPSLPGHVCIARGTPILTDRGLVPIQDVRLTDRVWDGIEFVSHDGAVCNGIQTVIEWDGLVATPNHKVLTDNGWTTLEISKTCNRLLAHSGLGRHPIRMSDHSDPYDDRKQGQTTSPSRLRSLWTSVVRIFSQDRSQASPRMSLLRAPLRGALSGMVVPPCTTSVATLQRSQGHWLSPLWWTWDRIPVRLDLRSYLLDCGTSWFTRGSLTSDRSHQQRRPLLTWQLALGNAQSADAESPQDSPPQFALSPVSSCISTRWLRPDVFGCAFSTRSQLCGSGRTMESVRSEEVWDIINAGPRHRFTASGKLVGNCVQDHGANFWFHGSPNLARHWELGDSGDRREYVHLQNMREDRIREPWRCPQCAGVRHGAGTCPYCGYQIAQATRCVVQLDGRLIEMNGKMFKPHRKATPDAMKLWLRTYWSHYKKGKTFRQAFAAFSYKHEKDFGYFAYPQLDWPGMPRQLWDHCERVSDVPFSALHKEPAHVHR